MILALAHTNTLEHQKYVNNIPHIKKKNSKLEIFEKCKQKNYNDMKFTLNHYTQI